MTKKEQLIIDFPVASSYKEVDFIVSESNLESYNFLRAPNLWNNCTLVLVGDKGAGKTHLSYIWQERFGAQRLSSHVLEFDLDSTHFVVDDLSNWIGDREKEEFLFHLYNHCLLEQKKILITSSFQVSSLNFEILDLRSRLMGAATTCLKSPDEYLMLTVFYKLCSDLQLSVDEGVVNYVVARCERSLSVVKNIVEGLNKKALSEKRKVTIALAKEILETCSQNENL